MDDALERLKATEAWRKVKGTWQEISGTEARARWWSLPPPVPTEALRESAVLLGAEARRLGASSDVAEALMSAIRERADHLERLRATCYRIGEGTRSLRPTRERLEKQYVLLERLGRQGRLEPEVVARAKEAIVNGAEALVTDTPTVETRAAALVAAQVVVELCS